MARFLPKLSLFCLPFLATSLLLLQQREQWAAEPFHNELEQKIVSVAGADPSSRLIIAGDSRAQTQVIPDLLHALIGIETVNVATASCDLITLYKALAKHRLLDGGRIFVISLSSFQTNDGALEPGYLSTAGLIEMSPWDAFKVFRRDPDKALPAYQGIVRRIMYSFLTRLGIVGTKNMRGSVDLSANAGFHPLEGKVTEKLALVLDPESIAHSWFKQLDNHGVRLRIFRETMRRLGDTTGNFLIYHAAMSPRWRDYTKGSFIEKAEAEFSEILREEAAKYPNMMFVDFYNAYRDSFPEEMFYDTGHLNILGAQVFTKILAGILEERFSVSGW